MSQDPHPRTNLNTPNNKYKYSGRSHGGSARAGPGAHGRQQVAPVQVRELIFDL